MDAILYHMTSQFGKTTKDGEIHTSAKFYLLGLNHSKDIQDANNFDLIKDISFVPGLINPQRACAEGYSSQLVCRSFCLWTFL